MATLLTFTLSVIFIENLTVSPTVAFFFDTVSVDMSMTGFSTSAVADAEIPFGMIAIDITKTSERIKLNNFFIFIRIPPFLMIISQRSVFVNTSICDISL